MLQLYTIHKETFSLLNTIVSHREMGSFSLAGGTALALHLGHRISVDLDFFTMNPFNTDELFDFLRDTFTVTNCSQAENSLSLYVESKTKNIKIDMIRHNYSLLFPIQEVNNIRLFSLEDIAAMKMNAVANRGCKKDFYDIHALLTRFSIIELLDFFEKKYQKKIVILLSKALFILKTQT